MISLGTVIGAALIYHVSTRKQYFVFIHKDGEFIFKKIVFYKSVPVDEIRKFEMYYPGPTWQDIYTDSGVHTEISPEKRSHMC